MANCNTHQGEAPFFAGSARKKPSYYWQHFKLHINRRELTKYSCFGHTQPFTLTATTFPQHNTFEFRDSLKLEEWKAQKVR